VRGRTEGGAAQIVRTACLSLVASVAVTACGAAKPTESAVPPSVRDTSPPPTPSPLTAEREGLVLEAELRATTTELIAEVVVRNDRDAPAHLVPDMCGRVVEVFLVRTAIEPEGRRWTGSVQAVKDLVLGDQAARQGPDRFHPPLPPANGDFESYCPRPEAPIELAPGEERAERWTLPRIFASALDAVGSEGSAIRVEVVEAKSVDELEFLNVVSWSDADGERAGRNVQIEQPADKLVHTLPGDVTDRRSRGELFDLLVAGSDELRGWIEEQPADGWRDAQLTPAAPGFGPDFAEVRLRLVTAGFERAAVVGATPDGSSITLELPGPEHRTRQFARRPATLPTGIALIPEPDAYELTDDVLLPEIFLPSGRLVVGEYLLDSEGLDVETDLPPGRYRVHATLATSDDGADARVAYATLVVSDAPTARWEEVGGIAVDGGTTAFISTEGRDALVELFESDEAAWERFWLEDAWDSQVAHDYLATELKIDGDLNMVYLGAGYGDGGYPVFVGFDTAGQPTQVVVDFYVVHLDWPGS
jgi:hypothetical protein